jgi:hypothetical protein
MAHVWAVAFREQAKLPTVDDLRRYRERMAAYAREPLPWHRTLRYRLGRLIAGRRPFAPHLDRDRWSVEVRGKAA